MITVCVLQGLIRLLSTCASGSAAAAEGLLLLRISSILKDILAGAGLVSSTTVSPSSVNRPPEQVSLSLFSPENPFIWPCCAILAWSTVEVQLCSWRLYMIHGG